MFVFHHSDTIEVRYNIRAFEDTIGILPQFIPQYRHSSSGHAWVN